ncbi:DUF4352 domain-containing protein [Clostridioides difficile]|uniref:DUF4352 domain-containing protein n=1 Tax=Clostridioides difficile TaxID=1496 RepID=UPI0014310203|nr:DUF4352 domain-containing protein [Clostridioides difficile]EGT4968507.1 DUF4352 domain-containing protein [Clostridioides difficile]MDI2927993.1 DUF4352 domain-containing protein [Clostridioides difficile]MDI6365756.1 DUF4352 domain-containing protein [Clostridioides difficile]NJA11513.1 DUF4352 domain-containing protein [Clostridioides difficile]HBE9815951.1 DUF4352 domain-containing protein [Clostridioides difficile]
MNKKILALAISIILSLSLVGCSTNDSKNGDSKPKQNAEEIKNHKLGEVVDLDGAKVSVKNVRKLETDTNIYAVEIEVTNTGDADFQSDFIQNYILKTNENTVGEAVNNQDLNGELLFDTIHPGDTLKGEIAFELTKDATPKTLEIAYENVGKYTVFDL